MRGRRRRPWRSPNPRGQGGTEAPERSLPRRSTAGSMTMLELAHERERMVERQVARRGVRDVRVLAAMREVPREAFVPQNLAEFAYEDTPLPIEAGQTISQPYIVAVMIEAAEIQPRDHVLEIGAGSGYAAA